MVMAAFYFRMHQPMRLHPDRDKFIWAETDYKIFNQTAEASYIPALRLFAELISKFPEFKIIMGMSGTVLEQAEMYRPEVIGWLQKLLDAGNGTQVEFLDETYYHSLTGFFSDGRKKEFRDQVSLHREMMKRFFGIKLESFRNTELVYNDTIAEVVSDMGYRTILCDRREDMRLENGCPVPEGVVLKAGGSDLLVVFRNRELSDEIGCGFSETGKSAGDCVDRIARSAGNTLLLGFDLEHVGCRFRGGGGLSEFWRKLAQGVCDHPEVESVTAADIAERLGSGECPAVEVPATPADALQVADWNIAEGHAETPFFVHHPLVPWFVSPTQFGIFKDIERLEADARRAGGDLLKKWRYLTISDHLCFLHECSDRNCALACRPNPYGGSIAAPTQIITRKIDDLEVTIKRFEILRRREKTAVLLISPETGKLPEDMGALAQYITGKSGGQGEVVSALCNGLVERGIEVHLATLNLKKRFQLESGMDEIGWRQMRYRIDPERIHLVSSSIFAENMSAYSGNPLSTAAEFQREIVNNIIKTVRAKSEGKLIVHTHDWMAGGVIAAYAKSTGLPVLHTVHNVFTGHIPLEMLNGVDLNSMSFDLFLSQNHDGRALDSQATAIKSASLVNFVGEKFLHEVVEDYFMDRAIVPWGVRNEVKVKYRHNAALSIINAPSPYMYPERCEMLVRKYGPNDDVLQAKKENRIEFQKRMGLKIDPNAILFYWPSRLDAMQKGVELIEHIAQRFVIEHGDVQIAFVADGVGSDRSHVDILGRIAWASDGKIAYHGYDEYLSMLGFAAANDVFGASLYEPCGQIDQVGNLFGATATNRDTGGYNDKIRELRLKIAGSPQDVGNGFLFRDYDSGGLWYAMRNSVLFHRLPESVRAEQIVRIMREARENYDLGNMIAQYIRVYERLNNGKPLG